VKAIATNSAFFWTERTSKPFKGFQRGRGWDYKNADMQHIRANLRDVKYLSPRLFGPDSWGGDNTFRGIQSGAFNIYGDYPDFFKIDPWTPISGRLLNEIDIIQNRKVCIIGERVAEVMFDEGEDPVGEYLKINGVFFLVVGVVRPETRMNIGGGQKNEAIMIPFSTMQRTYNMGDVVHFFSVTSQPGVPENKLEARLKELLKSRHFIAPDDIQAIGSFNIEVEYKKYKSLFAGIQILTWIVGVGTLFFLYNKSKTKPDVFEIESPFMSDVVKKTVATGSVMPRFEIDIKPQVSGIIDKLFVEAGDYVEKDQVIARIKIIPDMVTLNAAQTRVNVAKINFDDAKLDLERQQELFDKNVISYEEYKKAIVTHDSAREELVAAENNLELIKNGVTKKAETATNTLVRSTITGTVLDVPVKEGNSVIQSNILMTALQ